MPRPVSLLLHDYKTNSAKPDAPGKAWRWFALGLGLPLLVVAGFTMIKSASGSNQTGENAAGANLASQVVEQGEALTETMEAALNDAVRISEPFPQFFSRRPTVVARSAFHPPLVLPEAPQFDVVSHTIKSGDTLEQVFRRNKISLADLAEIVRLPEAANHLKMLRPGDTFEIGHDAGQLMSLYRELNLTESLQISRNDNGFLAELVERPIETVRRNAYGRIESSLFESAASAGLQDKLIMNLAGIFAWDIDFVLDIRTNDDYYILYEEIWQNGKFVTTGEIIAAEFNTNGRTFQAVRYVDPEGHSDYFTPDGRSVRKAFVRAPVDFTRISSNFNPNRKHPVLNTIRAHKGVDYAAPKGTPIKAAGDGKVIFRGRKGGYGNAVILQHGGNITTLYAHMTSFAKNARVGQRVRQGETIGFVGSTGLATAAHLHYEYRLNGVHRNPRTVQLPQADPIKQKYRNEFMATAEPILNELQNYKRTQIAAASFD
ncbi:MAG: peptidoglycan DD-metalloendopeptidase family protein [Woeseia sp.]